jgi:hypothetical protein
MASSPRSNPNQKTTILPDGEINGNDEHEILDVPDLDDDDLEEVDEPAPTTAAYMKFMQRGQVYDVLVTEFDRIGGRTFKDEPCPEVKGYTLRPTLTFRGETAITVPVAQLLTLTGSQARLARRLSNPDKPPKVDHRLVVEYTGEVHDKGKTIKTFDVTVGKTPMRLPTSWTSRNGDSDSPPPF